MANIAENITSLRQKIALACRKAGRAPGSVTLIAVAKTFPAAAVRQAVVAGVAHIGENYPQEAAAKIAAVAAVPPPTWHFIGRLQSNKTALVARHFDWVHSVDKESTARRLSRARVKPLQVCLQVNIDDEKSKSGVAAEDLPSLAAAVARLPNIHLRGLMAIPAAAAYPAEREKTRAAFLAMRRLQEKLIGDGLPLDTLSIGMSGDFDLAIAAGATHIRIGTAIFGERPHKISAAQEEK